MRLPPLIEGRLVRRYKRFLADIDLPGEGVVVCHCPDPGAMRNCAPTGARVWVSRSDKPRRKLAFTWELVEVGGTLVSVNTGRANRVVAEALEAGRVPELPESSVGVRAEVKLESGSRIDFRLGDSGGPSCYVEVKSVTYGVGAGVSAFPDSVTVRGARHVRDLAELRARGFRAVVFFLAARADTRRVRMADEIDSNYGDALRSAVVAGVEVLAYRAAIELGGGGADVRVAERVAVDL